MVSASAQLRRRLRSRAGFTLVELLVVVLIIGILIAVAAPSFLGQTHKANDSAAEQYLAVAYREAAAYTVSNDGNFGTSNSVADQQALADAINAGEGGLLFAEPGACPADATSDPQHIIVSQAENGDLTLCNAVQDGDTHTVWTLTVVDHALQPLTSETDSGTGIGAPRPTTFPTLSDPDSGSLAHIQVGDVLHVANGTWINNPTGFSYQWQRCDLGAVNCVSASGQGATSTDYTVDQSDLGSYLRVSVTGSNEGGDRVVSTDTVGPVLPATPISDANDPPAISAPNGLDHVQVGDQLSATPGTWSDNPTGYSYQWQTSPDGGVWTNAAGSGAQTADYTAATTDEGLFLRVVVQATNSGGTGAAASDATGAVLPHTPVNDSNAPPTIQDADNSLSHVQVGDQLTATTGTWSDSPAGYSFQWQTSPDGGVWTNASGAGALTASYTVAAGDEGLFLRVVVQATNTGGTGSAASDATSAVLPEDPINQVPPVIQDADNAMTHIQVGDHLSTTTGSWTDSPTGYSYQWQDSPDGGTWSNVGTDSSSYTVQAADLSGYLRVVVQATNPGGSTATASDATSLILPSTPINSVQPLVSDADNAMSHVQVGDHLSTTTGSWSDCAAPTTCGYSYTWQRADDASFSTNLTNVGGDSSTYIVQAADLSGFLRVVVQATNSGGQASTFSSNHTSAVLPSTPTNTTQPLVSDADNTMSHVQVGDHLSTTTGAWTDCTSPTPCSYSYTWQRADDAGFTTNLTTIGSDSSTYTVQAADISGFIRVVVQAQNSGGQAAVFSSNHSSAVLPATPVNSVQPLVSDADNTMAHVQVSDHLSTDTGTWSNNPTGYSYTWQRADDASFTQNLTTVGSNSSSYVVQTADLGGFIRVVVQAQNSGGAAAVFSSNHTNAVLPSTPTNSTQPLITDATNTMAHVQVGDSLSSSTGSWTDCSSPTPCSYAYTWQRADDASFSTNLTTVGTNSSSYTVQASDLGKYLRVSVQAQNTGGQAAVFSSNHSNAVLPATPLNQTAPTFAPAAVQVGQQETAQTGNWSNSPTGYSFQWQNSSNGTTWANASGTGSTSQVYTVDSSDYNMFLRVCVTAANAGGAASACSDPSTQAATPAVPVNTAAPFASGTAQVAQTVTTTNGTWTSQGSITGYSYTWRHSADGTTWTNASGAGAATSSYTVDSSDNNLYLQACVQAQNSGGSGSSVCSNTLGPVTAAIPVGLVVAYAGTTVPSGWALADGSPVSRASNSDLFAAIGTAYGAGDGSSTFNLPDLRGRMALGKASSGTGSTLGASGGQLDYGGGSISLSAPSFTFNVPASGAVNVLGLANHTHTWDPGHANYNCCGPSWSIQWAANNLTAAGGTSDGWTTINEAAINGLVPTSIPTPSATVSAVNAPFQSLRYIIKVSQSAGAPDCAIWGSTATAAPAGGVLAQGQAPTGTLSSCLSSSFSGALPNLQGRFPLGQASSGTGSTLGGTGGSIDHTHTLTMANQTYSVAVTGWSFTITPPAHTHPISPASAGQWSDCGGGPCNGGINSWGGATTSSNSPSASASYSPGTLTTTATGAQTDVSGSSNPAYQTVNYAAYTTSNYSPAAGTLTPYAGASAPTGWVIADGTCLSTSAYPALFAAIHYTYGGSSATFCLPNLSGRFALGKTSTGTGATLGSSGGTLSESSSFTVSAWQPSFTVPAHSYAWSIGTHTHTVHIGGNPGISGQTGSGLTNISGTCYNCDPVSTAGGAQTATSATVAARTVQATAASGGQTANGPSATAPYQVFNYIVYTGSASAVDQAAGAPSNTSPPTISGTAKNGQTLTGATGSWSNASSFDEQWQRCNSSGASCVDIANATSLSYTLTAADIGSTIRLFVLGENTAGTTSATSAVTASVGPLDPSNNTVAPAISGTVQVGQTLSTTSGTWINPTPTSYTYQWYDCTDNASTGSCTVIVGATTSSYTLQQSDSGLYIRSRVVAINSDNISSTPAYSAPTSSAAANPPPTNTGVPTLSGTTVVGQALTASSGSWSSVTSPLTYVYTWKRCDSAGANCSTTVRTSSSTASVTDSYTLVAADAGSTLKVSVVASNSGGSSSAATSAASAMVTTVAASGGTTAILSTTKTHTFTSSGTFTVTSGTVAATILLVAGGGGGGNPTDRTGGGGGAGGVFLGNCTLAAGTYTIVVGAGGAAQNNGGNSSITNGGNCGLTVIGGGHGGSSSSHATSGGSGGGRYHNGSDSPGSGTSGQGNGGGQGFDSGSVCNGFYAGGGGGAGASGNSASSSAAGAGGAGFVSSISGSAVAYGGGGGGGAQCNSNPGAGGNGGGGGGSANGSSTGNGSNGLGGGGGGGSASTGGASSNGGSGGSGVVIISYSYP